MDKLSCLQKWRDAPACYGWLSLDGRGNWRLQGERISHRGLIELMNQQYGEDEAGCWFVQNGAQRVFVDLACTPWIFRREGDSFASHTGAAAGALRTLYLDEHGSVLVDTALGIGLLDDRDLLRFFGECHDSTGRPASDQAVIELMTEASGDIYWQNIPLQPIASVDLEKKFHFIRLPRP